MAISRTHKIIRIIWVTFGLGALTWLFYSMQARGFDESILASDGKVAVEISDDILAFIPKPDSRPIALIFYPGALVDPEAYAPMARAIAESGYKVTVVKLPFRMAPLDRHQAEVAARTEALISQDPSIRSWVMAGHSRGGALAASFASKHPQFLAGLILVGTSHPREEDLSWLPLDVTKIYGSEDGLASEVEVKEYARFLPTSTHWVRVEGGNHAQFGWYGSQLGDDAATITREEQQRILVAAMLDALERVSN